MKRFRIPIVATIAVSVDAMNPRNKVYIDSREEAIDMGYVPCKRCNP